MHTIRVLAVLVLATACKQQPAADPPRAQAATAAAVPAAAQTTTLRGTIAEKIDAAQYSYLRLNTASGEVWAAVQKTDRAVGAEVTVVNANWMDGFKSPSMGRTWDHIAFGTLADGSAEAAAQMPPAQLPAGQLPAGHPAPGAGAGMFAEAAANQPAAGQGSPLHQHPTPSAPADVGAIKVAKAPGPSGRTIADVWARKAALKDQKVTVRAKVVKATNGVLGKNWLHLSDGTGKGPTADLAVASDDTASVGQTVLVTGVVHLDKDLGAGYHYDVIVEDAKIKAE